MSAPTTPQDLEKTRKISKKERDQYLLETGTWSDCRFIVGTQPNQKVFEAHKLFLATASPVFEAMFFGAMAEKDSIAILDIQPDAFKALLEYIYTDKINLTSFDQACELCYGAKKYMLPHLVEECTKYLLLDPKNACRAYEFGKLLEESILMDKSMHIIRSQTQEFLSEDRFVELELSTILTIFDQDELDISAEFELICAISIYAIRNQSSSAKVPTGDGIGSPSNIEAKDANHPTVRDAIMKIRFLTLTPQQFARIATLTKLLTESEKFAILMNICNPSTTIPMPPGFSTSRIPRTKQSITNTESCLENTEKSMETQTTTDAWEVAERLIEKHGISNNDLRRIASAKRYNRRRANTPRERNGKYRHGMRY